MVREAQQNGTGPIETRPAGAEPVEPVESAAVRSVQSVHAAQSQPAEPAEPTEPTEPIEAAEAAEAEPVEAEPVEAEPDARFTFANERTFLAWNRTALALMAAGLAIGQLLPPFPGVPWGRHALAIPLIVLGAVLSVAGYLEWRRNQRALRMGAPLPRSPLPSVLAVAIAGMAIIATVVLVLSELLR